ncbi:MAG TPA: CheR family methyltransferase [Blastocatellia bacterium]|nr:CheR family methyltransferase [Blastocatellia bacterium]
MVQAFNSNPHLKPLEQAMAARFGWQTNAAWRESLIAAVKKKAARLGLDDAGYCRAALRSPAELDGLADLVTNNETIFFRDPEQFSALRLRVLPELISARSAQRSLNVWSAVCSTGEEAYSLAIELCEALPAGESWKPGVLATDLRGSAITSAVRGRYAAAAIGRIDRRLRERYFLRAEADGHGAFYDAAPEVKRMIAFRRANLYDGNFWNGLDRQFDLIVCNNLLLYFHALAVRQTVGRIAGALREGGLLAVTKNEAACVHHPRLQPDKSLPGAFFRKV